MFDRSNDRNLVLVNGRNLEAGWFCSGSGASDGSVCASGPGFLVVFWRCRGAAGGIFRASGFVGLVVGFVDSPVGGLCRVVANVDAEPKTDVARAISALVAQVTAPVRWEEVVRRLASEGVDTYVEVGFGTVLKGLIRKVDRSARVLSVSDPGGVESTVAALVT